MDQQRRPQITQDRQRLPGSFGRVRRDADVARPARSEGRVEGAHGLLERRSGVEPVRVEDVDVLQAQPGQALVQAGEEVLARSEVAVGTGPHLPAGLAGDDQLVTVGAQVRGEDAAEVLLGRAEGRAVVVG